MNNEFLLGVLSAKISTLYTVHTYQVLKGLDESKLISYLFHDKLIDHQALNFKQLSQLLEDSLKNEVSSYVGDEDLIYTYFFTENKHSNVGNHHLLDDLKASKHLLPIVNKYHALKNLIISFRLDKKGIDKLDLKKYLLEQDIYDNDDLVKAYQMGTGALNKFVKELTGLDIHLEENITGIEDKIYQYFYKQIEQLSYSTYVEELLIYYIWMRKKQNISIKSIYHLGEVLYE